MGIPEVSFEKFTIPFKNVENVRIEHTDLDGSLRYFSHLFPNVRDLHIIFFSVDEDTAKIRLPHLENLTIMIDELDFSLKSLADILHENPQLQNLMLYLMQNLMLEITFNDVLNTISKNPLITKLKILNGFAGKTINTNQNDLMRLASERPLTVELALPKYLVAPENAIILIGQLKSLKMFQFLIDGRSNYDRLVSKLDDEWKCEHEHELFDGVNQYQTVTLKR